MADTGPPWNLRFPGPQDFVRETNFYIEDLAEDTAAALSLAGNEGIGPNLVQSVKTDTFTSTSTTFVTVTGLSVTITPTTVTSKVLVIAQISHAVSNNSGYGHFKVTRGGTDVYRGDAGQPNQVRAVFGGFQGGNLAAAILSSPVVFLDDPQTDDPVTYQVEVRQAQAGSVFINRTSADSNDAGQGRGASSITAIEVEA